MSATGDHLPNPNLAYGLQHLQAHWLSPDYLVIPRKVWQSDAEYRLELNPNPNFWDPNNLQPTLAQSQTLQLVGQLPSDLAQKFPYLAQEVLFKLPKPQQASNWLQQTVVVSGYLNASNLSRFWSSGVQIAAVLDQLYAEAASLETLGLSWLGQIPTLRVWAPTAKTVHLLYRANLNSPAQRYPMQRSANSGSWFIEGAANWKHGYYQYEVQVYAPSVRQVVNNVVSDPYSVTLSPDSLYSRIEDLNDPEHTPNGWLNLSKPTLASFNDLSIYELHLRDFSAQDSRVPTAWRGGYLAFTASDSYGMHHLRMLKQVGLKAVHLLPTFDIASIPKDKTQWQNPQLASNLPANNTLAAQETERTAWRSGYNWGYDPWHFNTPEGTYASQPEQRSLEYRQMVMSLNQLGLRVINDVVYNHTHGWGQGAQSIFDRIVPSYYYRLNLDGELEHSTCCANTASEHRMMGKFMLDSVLFWAKTYKIDGFRFDLMGHHMLANMQDIRRALDALTLERDGVDGKQIYIYGEGWDFGEVFQQARGVNASQLQLYGSGIGSFSDRLRDAVRGGAPFDADPRQHLGFATGLVEQVTSNQPVSDQPVSDQLVAAETVKTETSADLQQLLHEQALIRLSLAGNLRDYRLRNAAGQWVTGAQLNYRGQAAGYAAQASETVQYIAAHDNETFWDILNIKSSLPNTSLSTAQRVRLQALALSLVTFSQGIPFFQAAEDLLRSKSLDRNSYQSGDWFNSIDWSAQRNGWGVGLPPAENRGHWSWQAPLLANPSRAVLPYQIATSRDTFQEWMAIRNTSSLFRLNTLAQIQASVRFLREDVAGSIVMELSGPLSRSNPYLRLLIVFNAQPNTVALSIPELANYKWFLHPVLMGSVDNVVKLASVRGDLVSVPALSTAVFYASPKDKP